MERSFAAEVKQLALGEGQILRGEGILAITRVLLQSGVSDVGEDEKASRALPPPAARG
jgi:indolepyruvate ferredoxin oxidoreductase alpha subunit